MATAFDSHGNMFISTYGSPNCQVLKVTPAGVVSVFAGTGTCANSVPGPALSSPLNKPTSLAVDSNDNLYVNEDTGYRTNKITPSGTLSWFAGTGASGTVVEGPATSSPLRPAGLVIDGSDNVYLGDWINHKIVKVTQAGVLSVIAGNGTTTVTPGPAVDSGLNSPYGLARDSQGNLLSTDFALNYVYKITPGGILSIIGGNGTASVPTPGPALSSSVRSPWGLTVDGSDNVYVALFSAPSIIRITPGGSLSIAAGTGVSGTTVPGPATATQLKGPNYVTFHDGAVYYAELNGHRVNRLVRAEAPGAPTNLRAAPGDGAATLTFTPPTGGGAVTGYQISTDDGATWAEVTTTAGAGGTRVAEVGDLTNGATYHLRLRAVGGGGNGPSSDAVAVTPGMPLPPASVTATAGVSSVEVSWSPAVANGLPVTRYVVTASPGPATCETTGATRCIVGGVAGTTYTYTVQAYAGSLASAVSGRSNAATPNAPPVTGSPPTTSLLLTTTDGEISTAVPGQKFVLLGEGFAAHSTVTITLYSDPVSLGRVTTSAAGTFRKAVTVPAGLEGGDHQFVASGVDPDGNAHYLKLAVNVLADHILPTTDSPLTAGVILVGFGALVAGGGLLLLAFWRRIRERATPV
ncbi:hypothetical protein KRMM14A1259_51880 [Krasilnikovia sp. MM14-A1259]